MICARTQHHRQSKLYFYAFNQSRSSDHADTDRDDETEYADYDCLHTLKIWFVLGLRYLKHLRVPRFSALFQLAFGGQNSTNRALIGHSASNFSSYLLLINSSPLHLPATSSPSPPYLSSLFLTSPHAAYIQLSRNHTRKGYISDSFATSIPTSPSPQPPPDPISNTKTRKWMLAFKLWPPPTLPRAALPIML